MQREKQKTTRVVEIKMARKNSEEVANPGTEGEQGPENEESWKNGEPEDMGDPEMKSEDFSDDKNEFGDSDGHSGDAETGDYTGGREATPNDENAPNEDVGGNDDASPETKPATEDDTLTDSGGDGVVKQIVQAGKKAKKALIDGTNYIEKQFESSWNGDEGEQTGLKNDNSWDEKDDAGGEDLGQKLRKGDGCKFEVVA